MEQNNSIQQPDEDWAELDTLNRQCEDLILIARTRIAELNNIRQAIVSEKDCCRYLGDKPNRSLRQEVTERLGTMVTFPNSTGKHANQIKS